MVAIVSGAHSASAIAAPLTLPVRRRVRVALCRTTRAARARAPRLPAEPRRDLGARASSWSSGSTERSTHAAASGTAPACTSSGGHRRLGALGQRLVPPDRRARLLLAVEHARLLPALPAPRRPGSAGSCSATTVLAGVLISLAAGSAAFVLLYRLTSLRLGEEAARRTVLFLAVAPTSLFFGAVYSESLFLLLAVATFLLAERGRFWEAGAAAGLALLTRSAGVALLPALVVLAWRAPDRRRALAGVARGAAPLRALPARARDLDRPPARVPRRAEGGLGAAALTRRAARRRRRSGAGSRAARPRRRVRPDRARHRRLAADRRRPTASTR